MATQDGYILGELKAGVEECKRRLEALEDREESGDYEANEAPQDGDLLTQFMQNPDKAVAFGQMAGAVLKGLLPKDPPVIEHEAKGTPASSNGAGASGNVGNQKT